MEYVLLTLAAASPNRAYLASLRFAQIPLRGTSDTLETLCDIHAITYEK